MFWSRCSGESSGRVLAARRVEPLLLPNNLTHELEELKLSLIRMRPDELEASQSEKLRQEISAIRLQLKRLELERLAVAEDLRRMYPRGSENASVPG